MGSVLGGVAGTGDGANPAFQTLPAGLEHFLGKIDGAITSGLWANERPAPVERFAGEDAGEFVGETFVLTEQITDLTTANAYIARRDVSIGAHMTKELGHERLAKTHDFVVGFALRIEIGAAFSTAHR